MKTPLEDLAIARTVCAGGAAPVLHRRCEGGGPREVGGEQADHTARGTARRASPDPNDAQAVTDRGRHSLLRALRGAAGGSRRRRGRGRRREHGAARDCSRERASDVRPHVPRGRAGRIPRPPSRGRGGAVRGRPDCRCRRRRLRPRDPDWPPRRELARREEACDRSPRRLCGTRISGRAWRPGVAGRFDWPQLLALQPGVARGRVAVPRRRRPVQRRGARQLQLERRSDDPLAPRWPDSASPCCRTSWSPPT